jgi:ribosomal protein L22
MVEEINKNTEKAKGTKKMEKTVEENKIQAVKTEEKVEATKTDKKPEVKKVENKKKDYALVIGTNLPISSKESFSVCNMIRNRNIDIAIKMVEEVLQYKRVVKMNDREVPHQHGKGIMAGRFPLLAAKEFLKLLKSLRANAIYNELELEKSVISCKADFASRPFRRGGSRFKRTNVMIRLDKKKQIKGEKKNK